MEKTKPVVMQEDDFEYQDEAIITSHFYSLDCRDFDAKNKLKQLPSKSFFPGVHLLLEN